MAERAIFSSYRRPEPSFKSTRAVVPSEVTNGRPSQDVPVFTNGVPASGLPAGEGAGRASDVVAARPTAATHQWADLSAIDLDCDQLGLAHPDIITVLARLPGAPPVQLEADSAGLYRPPGFRASPWSGFAYDQVEQQAKGLAAGSRILTARGEIEVENLLPGDSAMALRGPALLAIRRISRTVATVRLIRIETDALSPGVPRQTLRLGPEQDVFITPQPVAARTLVNGSTIQEDQAATVDLFHIDLGRAEVIFAEGLALSSSHGASTRA